MTPQMEFQYQIYSSHCQECVNRSTPFVAQEQWMNITETTLYYAYPTVVIFGIVSGLVSVVVLGRQVSNSNDVYLICLGLANTFILICGGFLWMPLYIGYYDLYQRMHVYFLASNDWFWYVSLWMIMVMCLERCLTLTQNRSGNMCSPIQTLLCAIMIYGVCLISALPRLWESDLHQVVLKNNQTVLISKPSTTSRTPEFRIMYFWYRTSITIFLPLPVLLVLTCLLSTATRSLQKTKRRISNGTYNHHGTNMVMYRKAEEEVSMTSLFVSFVACYLIFTTPKVMVDFLPKITIGLLDTSSKFYHVLHDLAQTVFYLNFAIPFFMHLCHHPRFRMTMKHCLVCRKGEKNKYAVTRC